MRVLICAAAAAGRLVINSAPRRFRSQSEREKQRATRMTNASGALHTQAAGQDEGMNGRCLSAAAATRARGVRFA